MMKKLAVTVFALSLTALGCGSDDGGKKDAARTDGSPGAEVQVDTPIQPDGPSSGPEVQVDKPMGPEVQAVEVQAVEVQAVEVGIDTARVEAQAPVDGGTPDAPTQVEIDAQPMEAGQAVDGATAVDSGSAG